MASSYGVAVWLGGSEWVLVVGGSWVALSGLFVCDLRAGEKYSSVSADYRHGSSGGEVDWWLVRCHGESGEVVDVSIFFHSFHSVLLVWWLGGWVMKLTRWLGG